MITLKNDLFSYIRLCKEQDFAFYTAFAYIIFTYLRPQAIYPWFDILPWTQLSIVAGLVYLALNGRIRVQFTHVLLALYCGVITLSAYQSYYQDYSLSKLHIPLIWAVEVIFFTSAIRGQLQYRLITIAIFLVLFKISFFGARTWFGRGFGFSDFGISGPPGYFTNSGELSLLMAMLAVVSVGYFRAIKPSTRWYYALPITAVMTVLAASSRGGQLALAIALSLLLFKYAKLNFRYLFLFGLLGFLGYSLVPEEQMERFYAMGSDNTSQSRLLYWEKGIEMTNENPWLGVGHNAFARYFKDRYKHLQSSDQFLQRRSEVAHNSLVQIGSTTGYIGLSLYLALHLHCLMLNRKTRKHIARLGKKAGDKQWMESYATGLDYTLLCFFIGALFMSVAFYPYIYLMLMLCQCLHNSAVDKSPEKSRVGNARKREALA